MASQPKPVVPRIAFEAIQDDYHAKGIDLTDVNQVHGNSMGDGHFERWRKAKGLPDHDSEGTHFRSSKIFYRQYQQDPAGEASQPLFVNLWHYLLKISDSIEWKETDSERTKSAPATECLLTVRPDLEDEELIDLRRNLEAKNPMSDEMFDHYVTIFRQQHRQEVEARKYMLEIIEQYGVEVPDYGKLLFIEMTVER